MSSRAAAKIMDMDEEMVIEVDLANLEPELTNCFVGDPIKGDIYLTTHTCGFCQSSLQTIGTGYTQFFCSNCAAVRSRQVEMSRSFECLEAEE